MRKIIFFVLAASGLAIFSGCSNKVATYANSPQNVRAVKELAASEKTMVAVAPFTAQNEGESKVMCRIATPVGTPDGITFAKYIEDALILELEIGNMYDPKSNTKITAYLEKVYGSTVIFNAYWEFKAKVSSSNGKSFDVESKYDYESSYLASSACSEMQRSYMPAVQQLVNKIITDPKFKELLKQ
jgi:hypothetical protein